MMTKREIAARHKSLIGTVPSEETIEKILSGLSLAGLDRRSVNVTFALRLKKKYRAFDWHNLANVTKVLATDAAKWPTITGKELEQFMIAYGWHKDKIRKVYRQHNVTLGSEIDNITIQKMLIRAALFDNKEDN